MTKRIKMEIDDGKGGKFTFSFNGPLDNTQLSKFNSQDMLECYRAEYNDSIPLSTIATYLTRLYDRNMLNRERTRTGWSYRKLKPIDILNK